MVSHTATRMTRVQHPAKGLGEIIARVEDPREMFHDQVALFTPFLNSEVLDLDVSGTRCGSVLVDHVQCGSIVDQHTGRDLDEGHRAPRGRNAST